MFWIVVSILVGFVAVATLLVTMQAAFIYNRLIRMDKVCDNSFAQIEVQLKRRYDLIPNLVEAVRGYLGHEKETLEKVIAARNQASRGLAGAKGSAEGMAEWVGAESALMGAMGKMSFVMEAYPDLKANESVNTLMEEIRSTENKIAFARQAFNDWITEFNTYRETFPTVLFAGFFGFNDERALLEFDDSEQIVHAPKVELVTN